MAPTRTRALLALTLLGTLPVAATARAAEPLVVDADDDDGNRIPDGEQDVVRPSAELGELALDRAMRGAVVALAGPVRLLADGRPLADGARVPAGVRTLAVQATAPGPAVVAIGAARLARSAVEVVALAGTGAEIDLARSHASLVRLPPARLGPDPAASDGDADALRFVLAGRPEDLPAAVALAAFAASGRRLGTLGRVELSPASCPARLAAAAGLACRSTPPIRVVSDEIDAEHPVAAARSIVGELGGVLVLERMPSGDAPGPETGGPGRAAGALGLEPARAKLQALRIAAPRGGPFAGLERLRGKLRVSLVRLAPGGTAPIGGDDAGARAMARLALARANQLWGACGVSFGPEDELLVSIVDPPPSHLLAVGCDHGLPARADGALRFAVGGVRVAVPFAAGQLPAEVARLVAARLRALGLGAEVSDNPPIAAAAYGASDVLVRRPGGALASLDLDPEAPLSSDPNLAACIGAVDLDDGLQHFGDVDAVAGTVEERTLLTAFDDGDPRTVDVVVVPGFAHGGRIGESFIGADGGPLRNVIVVDRGGVQASRASFTLAHELGHVLLDDPGHPDDYGLDAPTELMDADAANPSAFGPRRLGLAECARVLSEAGPGARLPLLESWPLEPLGFTL
ncbi:MAG: hypothetical protein HY908_14810 [Myxococcales bacterium]|nr:hypothetical protein [Myxococcales bacterium]